MFVLDLLQSLCHSKYWHADLCKFLLKEVSFVGDLYHELPLSRAVPLLASISDDNCSFLTKVSDILDGNSSQINNALNAEPTPSWIVDLATLVEPHLS